MTNRLLYVIGQLSPGGAERQLFYLLRNLDKERHRPAVAVWNRSEQDVYLPLIRDLGVSVYTFPARLSAWAKLKAFRRLVIQLRPEVVHSYSFYLNFAAHCVSQGTRAIAFGSIRSNFVFDWERTSWWLARLSARWPRNQVYNSSAAAEAVGRLTSLYVPQRVFVIRNGVDLRRFSKFPLARKERVNILGVGSLLPVKRWDRLLLAADKLKRRGFNFLIRILGDGPLRQSLEKQAQDLGVSDCTKFQGYTSDIACLLSETTFLVHTSEAEGCPNAVMEAMACGRAVVATNVGDIPFLVDDGETGFVVPFSDDAALAKCMERLITDFDLCRRMGESARAKAEREFGLERLVPKTLAAYRAAGWREV